MYPNTLSSKDLRFLRLIKKNEGGGTLLVLAPVISEVRDISSATYERVHVVSTGFVSVGRKLEYVDGFYSNFPAPNLIENVELF